MAFTTTTRGPAGPHRRRVLAGGAAVLLSAGAGALLTGCSGASGAPSGPSAAERLRAAAGRESVQLLARYDATIAAHGALAERLRPLREEVARHAEAFGAPRGASGAPHGATAPAPSGSSASSTPSASSAPSASSESSEPSEPSEASESSESSPSESSSAEASAAPGASASGASASARTDGVPGDEKAALAALADAERRTADSRTKALGSAPPELARLLASVAAAGAAHAYLLRSDA
ncbi:hypothetical protein [Streptomyces aureoversilis]|uniref:Lipoprotein n=1 Tax=Streptomyces aureoversilis TaxID=67277 RepID=A0ABW0ACR7_9ACTN